eukprot:CAMPEP_0185825530 /NCGR_PEP_ID=MMETSP1322-20130828/31091_1 /TAXON_ID=265543 /ORGANISM="Minutocellus polymorphus, Strain RCC2270" /LENGTH=326 /DNA_ID=CAMNT_0028523253 /DNA_START=1113 /DNA_END=2093 /DNA_ORIENTATION=-
MSQQRLRSERDEERKANERLRSERDDADKANERLRSERDEERKDSKRLRSERDDARKDSKRLRSERDDERKEVAALRSRLDAALQSKAAEIAALKAQLDASAESKTQLTAAVQSKDTENASLREEVAALQAQLESKAAENAGLVLTALDRAYRKLEHEALSSKGSPRHLVMMDRVICGTLASEAGLSTDDLNAQVREKLRSGCPRASELRNRYQAILRPAKQAAEQLDTVRAEAKSAREEKAEAEKQLDTVRAKAEKQLDTVKADNETVVDDLQTEVTRLNKVVEHRTNSAANQGRQQSKVAPPGMGALDDSFGNSLRWGVVLCER